MDIHKLITNIDKEHNISYDDINKIGSGFLKLNIYNPDIFIPMHKFWFYIDNVKIINNKDNNIEIALSEKNNGSFINYINKMENDIQVYINNYISRKSKLRKSVELSIKFFPIIKCKIIESSILYDENDNIINDVKSNDIINLFFELDDVTINKNNFTCWITFNALQIKKNKLFDIRKSLFCKSHSVPIIPPPPLPLLNQSNNESNNQNNPIKPVIQHKMNSKFDPPKRPMSRIDISASDIMSQLGKLKKTNYQNEKPVLHYLMKNNDEQSVDEQVFDEKPVDEPINDQINDPINDPVDEQPNDEPNDEHPTEELIDEPIDEKPIDDENRDDEEKHNNYMSVMEEMIYKIKKRNKKVNKQIALVDDIIKNVGLDL